MTMEVEVGDDLWIEQADSVARDGVPKTRMKLFRHGRAAGHVPSLEHRDLEPGAREVVGADEAVVPASDDENVPGT